MLNNQAKKLMNYQLFCSHLWTAGKDGYTQEETRAKVRCVEGKSYNWKHVWYVFHGKKEKKKKTKRNADTVVVICKRKSWRHDKFRYKDIFSITENTSFHRYYSLNEVLVETKQRNHK